MFKVIRKQILNTTTKRIDIEAPEVAVRWKPGQFIVLMADQYCLSLAFTAIDVDPQGRFISITFQEKDYSTKKLGEIKIGESLYSLLGPLGQPLAIQKYGSVMCASENEMLAAMLPVCRALRQKKNRVFGVANFDHQKEAILQTSLRTSCDHVAIVTNEQSYYKKGSLEDTVEKMIEKNNVKFVYAHGSLGFLKKVADVTKKLEVSTKVNLIYGLFDGRNVFDTTWVKLQRKALLACADSLIVDAHSFSFDSLIRRQQSWKEYEQCQTSQWPRKVPTNGSGIFPKLFRGLAGAKQ